MDNEEQRDHAEEAYNRRLMREDAGEIGTREGDALIAEAAQLPRTAAATAARIRARLDRQAEELRGAGYHVLTPEDYAREREVWAARHTGRNERHEFGVHYALTFAQVGPRCACGGRWPCAGGATP